MKTNDPPKQKEPLAGRIRPLRRVGPGVWKSRDKKWTFIRHRTDPKPQRWFAYGGTDREPFNAGYGHSSLAEVAQWTEIDNYFDLAYKEYGTGLL